MKYNPSIHPRNHLIKSFLGRIEHLAGLNGIANDDLVVLNYHGTPKKFSGNFRRQVDYYLEHFNIISPSEIEKYFRNEINTGNKPFLAINFDDGIKNNLLAAEIMGQYQIKATFFIVPDFVEAKNQQEFFLKNIRPLINRQIDSEEEDTSAMSWNDLKMLLEKGHEIGSHTSSHTLVAAATNDAIRHYEIVESKRRIAEKLSVSPDKIKSFCGSVNSLLSIGKEEMKLIKNNYQYCYTSFPGSNAERNPFFIKRVNVESFWMPGTVRFALGNWERKRWKSSVSLFYRIVSH